MRLRVTRLTRSDVDQIHDYIARDSPAAATQWDIVVVAMTSNPAMAPFSFRIQSTDLVEGSLNRPGTIRANKIYTLARSIIVKKFGKVSPYSIASVAPLPT